jgi:cobalt-zinc-cadmium efflux system protein
MTTEDTQKSQGHHHDMNPDGSRRLVAVMVLNILIPAAQVYGGIVSGSMALVSDALHNLSDFFAVAMSYVALRLGRRGPSLTQTFGYRRAEVLAAFLNVAVLYGLALLIAFEAIKRFLDPQPVAGAIVVWLALIAFAANAFSVWLLQAGARTNLNLRGAFLHMLSDALMSLGVAAVGVIWLFRPWYWLDPIISLVIVLFIFHSGWDVLKRSVLVLMNATPAGADLREIQEAIASVEGVRGVHHLHIWTLDTEGIALAAHILVHDQMLSQVDELADRIRELLNSRFGVDHPILQFEVRPYETPSLLCCVNQPSGLG